MSLFLDTLRETAAKQRTKVKNKATGETLTVAVIVETATAEAVADAAEEYGVKGNAAKQEDAVNVFTAGGSVDAGTNAKRAALAFFGIRTDAEGNPVEAKAKGRGAKADTLKAESNGHAAEVK